MEKMQPPTSVNTATTVRWVLAEENWQPGINTIAFYYGRTGKPSDFRESSDSRELAVAFHGFQLVVIPDDH